MEYRKLDVFLERIKSIISTTHLEKSLIIESIRAVTNIQIKEEQIETRGKILRLKITGTQKTAIILRKKELLEEINRVKKSHLTDIL